MNTNKQAVMFLENQEYDKAFKMFQKAVLKSRDVQSLNNLAYYYAYEEYQEKRAIELLKESIQLNPKSHFPYSFLGQLLVGDREKKYEEAIPYLVKSLEIKETYESRYNLAVCYFHLGEKQKALESFSKISNTSNNARFCYARMLFETGKKEKAKTILDDYKVYAELFSDDIFCEANIAEFYYDMECFDEAIFWYEKTWESYAHTIDIVSGYAYCLIKKNQLEKAKNIIDQTIISKRKEIIEEENEFDFDERYTKEDKDEYLKRLYKEKDELENILGKIISGYIPRKKFKPAMQARCYLFGCTRHGHPEYMETKK